MTSDSTTSTARLPVGETTLHDAIVVVHGIGDGMRQGDFLVDIAEPLTRWIAESGATIERTDATDVRRGGRPAMYTVSGTAPDRDASGKASTRPFEWRFIEAFWSDEHLEPPAGRALAWSRRAFVESVFDQLSYYDTVWRFWRWWLRSSWLAPLLSALIGGMFPSGDRAEDDNAWRYRYQVSTSSLPKKAAYALAFGVLAPVAFIVTHGLFYIPMLVPWLLTRPADRLSTTRFPRLHRGQAAYWNACYRVLLTIAWVPVLAVGEVFIFALSFVNAVPFEIPYIEPLRRRITRFVQFQFGDLFVYNREFVQSAAVREVLSGILEELATGEDRPRAITVLAHSQGTVVSYEVLSEFGREGKFPGDGQRLTFISVGSVINRSTAAAWRGSADTQRRLLAGSLPEGTRWLDIWAQHDPGPMGTMNAQQIKRAGVPPFEKRVANTMTHISAHTTYWHNSIEVIATVAEELLAGGRPLPPASGPWASVWTNPNGDAGFWGWRERNGAGERRAHALHGGVQVRTATWRAVGYVATIALISFAALGGGAADRMLTGLDETPLVQTPIRWFWEPQPIPDEPAARDALLSDIAAGDSPLIVLPRDNASPTIQVHRGAEIAQAPVTGADQARTLRGPGTLLRWWGVRYVAFPAIVALASSIVVLTWLEIWGALERALLARRLIARG